MTGNSKPDSPYQPACVRSVTSGQLSVRLCTASASWCWINGWNVWHKLNFCLLRRHDHTKVVWSPWLPFMISIFHLRMMSLTHFEDLTTKKMAARATAARARDSKYQSKHRRRKPAAGSQINVTLWMNFKLICWRLNLHRKVRYKSEKALGLWSEWHYITRGLVYGYK